MSKLGMNRRGFLAGLTGLAASLGLVKPETAEAVKVVPPNVPIAPIPKCGDTGVIYGRMDYGRLEVFMTVNGQTSKGALIPDGCGYRFDFDPCCPPFSLNDCNVTITE